MKRVCVFCGAGSGSSPVYEAAARRMGEVLAQGGYTLVYGGGAVGLMGALADGALSRGGEVIGILPRFFEGSTYLGKEVVHPHLTELRLVSSMQERKIMMIELSEAFIALPGGLGTIDELFEVWTLAKLGIHDKAFGILNAASYYDSFLEFVGKMTIEGFVEREAADLLLVDDDPQALVKKLKAFHREVPPAVQYKV